MLVPLVRRHRGAVYGTLAGVALLVLVVRFIGEGDIVVVEQRSSSPPLRGDVVGGGGSGGSGGRADVERALRKMNETLYERANFLPESKIRALLDVRLTDFAIAARFPLPELPFVCTIKGGSQPCLIGKACEQARRPSKWNPDTHIRDVIISLMLDCALPWGPHRTEPCVAHDVGANVGLISLTMVRMGAHVISVEPQVDLCVALRATLEGIGEGLSHLVLCGGVGRQAPGNRMKTSTGLYRYEGQVPPAVATHYPKEVPLYNVEQLVGPFKHLKFAKIDTDSHDCVILEQYLELIEQKRLTVESLILETWDWSCLGGKIGELLHRFSVLGYSVYRTLTPRDFDDNGWDTRNNFKPLPEVQPRNSTEQYHQRTIRHTWKLHPRSRAEWVSLVQEKEQVGRIYFVTTAKIYEQGYISA